jgi:hypothetical protein
MDDSERSDRLQRIAETLRQLPSIWRGKAPGKLAIQAGELLLQAIDLGAFGGEEHIRLHQYLSADKLQAKDRRDLCCAAWDSAAAIVTPNLDWNSRWTAACPIVADLIDGEAAAIDAHDQPGTGRKRKRGTYKTDYDRVAEGKLYDQWNRSRHNRIADFARELGRDPVEVHEILERERGRRRRLP